MSEEQKPVAIQQAFFDGGWHDIAEDDLWQYQSPQWPDCPMRVVYSAPKPITPTSALRAPDCTWAHETEDGDTWISTCGHLWSFTDGGPSENDCRYCHKCGGKILIEEQK